MAATQSQSLNNNNNKNKNNNNNSVPSSATFSFKAPFLPASATASTSTSTSASGAVPCAPSNPLEGSGQQKQRRVSLALPSSPRLVPAWNFRDDTSVPYADAGRKGRVRRIDTNTNSNRSQHGVGNWKAILSDPTLTFAGRSPVDLKDR
ncbi:hypothetical protein C8F04DRAFT_1301918 [Mycena alexandri]|uniref:Uncharacterized protein n=1 Tax=Mycena alexandri TaxID=1745969 RepID=A0AAD6SBW1_9AGAR|nr:hypothetical protein C8F04DRAFT_1301918 [Mycena alexandri]